MSNCNAEMVVAFDTDIALVTMQLDISSSVRPPPLFDGVGLLPSIELPLGCGCGCGGVIIVIGVVGVAGNASDVPKAVLRAERDLLTMGVVAAVANAPPLSSTLSSAIGIVQQRKRQM